MKNSARPAEARAPARPIALRETVGRADVEAVRAIVAAAGFFRPDEIEVAAELVEDCLARGEKASGYRFLFAEAPGEPVPAGYACYGPIPCTLTSWDLYWIAVRPEHRRRGVGALLMERLEAAARAQGCLDMYIETSARPQYDPTRAFYLARGYRIEHVFPDFYAAGDGRAVYVKRLR
ncbi:MAG: GNAT family N-acetyltransferase [Rhodospirillales bacterium]